MGEEPGCPTQSISFKHQLFMGQVVEQKYYSRVVESDQPLPPSEYSEDLCSGRLVEIRTSAEYSADR